MKDTTALIARADNLASGGYYLLANDKINQAIAAGATWDDVCCGMSLGSFLSILGWRRAQPRFIARQMFTAVR